MKLIVTGSSGFLGINLVKKLLQMKYEVLAIDLIENSYSHPLLTNIQCDVKRINELQINTQIDAILHTAAKINYNSDDSSISELTDVNIIGNLNVADFAIRHKIPKVILSSTCAVYKENFEKSRWITEDFELRPKNLYANSKLTGEWIMANRMKGHIEEFIILRYSSIYGIGQKSDSILPKFIQKARSNESIEIYGTGDRTQDYVFIDDVVQANINCLNTKLSFNDIFNIGSGQPISDYDLSILIKKIWKSSSEIKILNKEKKPGLIFNYSISKARNLIKYKPVFLEDGLELYHEYC